MLYEEIDIRDYAWTIGNSLGRMVWNGFGRQNASRIASKIQMNSLWA